MNFRMYGGYQDKYRKEVGPRRGTPFERPEGGPMGNSQMPSSSRDRNRDNNRGSGDQDRNGGRSRRRVNNVPAYEQIGSSSSALQTSNTSQTLENVTSSTRSLNRAQVFDMYHTKSESEMVGRFKFRWWWLIRITLECYWDDDESSVGNAVMVDIHENMTRAFESRKYNIEEALQMATNDPTIRVGLSMPSQEEDDQDREPAVAPTSVKPEQSDSSLDPNEWDWRKYLGMGLLLATLVSVVALRIMATRRQRAREHKHLWGNLASKEGVDALLNTAWVLDGSKMQIYDKTKMGYKDDDSIFLGGYEQREAVVGAEITVTHPMTETSPSDLPRTSPSFLSSKKSDPV